MVSSSVGWFFLLMVLQKNSPRDHNIQCFMKWMEVRSRRQFHLRKPIALETLSMDLSN